ncbi:MAG: hypothetical protein OYG31_03345 [Candidatus Kaiserbacteria bacterium]|nr:hypothetical protein [Candidatus Kaiserbacteria bacterium]
MKPKRPNKRGFTQAYSEKKGCWIYIPTLTGERGKRRSATMKAKESGRPVEKVDPKTGKVVARFPSVLRASQKEGCVPSTIWNICGGVYGFKSYKGFSYRFVDGKRAPKRASAKRKAASKKAIYAMRKRLREKK